MARLTGLWWWIDRWRKSTAHTDMSLEQQGAYRNLLDEAHLRGGPIPNDEEVLAKACGDPRRWSRVRDKVMIHFTLTSEGWRNETLDEVIQESQRRADKQRRWRNNHGNASGNANGNTRSNKAGNKAGNNRGSPDPDPDLKERTKDLPKKPADPRVKEFLEWFQIEFKARRNGADYLVHWQRDSALVKAMLQATELPRLQDCARILLSDKTDDAFIVETDRGIGILSTKFNWLQGRLSAWETRQKTTGVA